MELSNYIKENGYIRAECVDECLDIPRKRLSTERYEYIRDNRVKNRWLWGCVTLSMFFGPLVVRRKLRKCSYRSEQDFRAGPEYSIAVTRMTNEIIENMRWIKSILNEWE
jgi:hypothetical protein